MTNISKSSGKNFFLEKSYTKCSGENIPYTLFWKTKIEKISGLIVKSLIQFVFIVCKAEDYRDILKLSCKLLAFIAYKAFLKNKKRSGTSFTASFSAYFLKKNNSLVMFHYLIKFHYLVAFTSWDIGQYVCCNWLLTRLWRQKSWNNTYLSNQFAFSTWPKSQYKNLNILRTKRVFKKKHKVFFIIFKRLSLKQIKQFFWKVRVQLYKRSIYILLMTSQ